MSSVLYIDEKTIEKSAALHGLGTKDIFKIALNQAMSEQWVRFKTRLSFRHRENDNAVKAYGLMNEKDFEGINARQRWANWRSIPRNLSGNIENKPLKAIDLCSGIGHSTQVLAHYLPYGSSILGLEYNPQLVEAARFRKYKHSSGKEQKVEFHAQSVLDPFFNSHQEKIPAQSIHLINCVGAVGFHFDPMTTEKLAEQIHIVLAPGGVAMLDSGSAGTNKDELISIFTSRGYEVLSESKGSIFDLYTQVCFKKQP
jgi:SAM-dependent methyltransferase